jgi:hypothetical protein
MKTEIDLVHEYMSDLDGSAPDFLRARAALDEAIALERPLSKEGADTRHRSRPRRRRTLRWGIGVTLVAAVSAAAVVLVAPSAKIPGTPAAAAEIARLAQAVQPVPPLGAGQWYQYQLQGELSANVTSGLKAAPVSATGNIPVTIGDWSNATSAVCSSQQFGTVTFDAPGDAQAWQTMGLTTTPANQPATGCAAGLEAAYGGAGTPVGPIDVSNITHDPATLEEQLQAGTTGISVIDHYATGEAFPLVGFLRLTDLLVGPVRGRWSGFGQEMLNTLARIPGIDTLGTMATHSGATGPAFSMPKQVSLNPSTGAASYTFTPPTVILDPQNGSLLEARNFDFPVLQSAAQDFVGSPDAMVYSDGVSYGVTAQWVDPVSGLQVVDPSALPSWISTFHIIEAVTSPVATASQLSAVINPFLGNGNSDYSDGSPGSAQSTDDITIMGTQAMAQSVANALTASGLFTSVTVEL